MYDTIIIGGGPAGMTCAIYLLRANKKVVMLERMMPGGQVGLTHMVDNYPGIPNIEGIELATKMFEHATSLGLETRFTEALSCELDGEIKKVRTREGVIEAKSVFLCLGASAKELNVPNEGKFRGRGVSYCATCDGNFFKGKTVAVVGGGNTSFEDVVYLSGLCKKIYLIHRRDEFRGDQSSLEKIENLEKIGKVEILLNSVVTSINGEQKLASITIENKLTKVVSDLEIEGLFIAVGRAPDTSILGDSVELDQKGYIITDDKMQTNISGVYAGGDVRNTLLRQIVTACSDGAIASVSICNFLAKHK